MRPRRPHKVRVTGVRVRVRVSDVSVRVGVRVSGVMVRPYKVRVSGVRGNGARERERVRFITFRVRVAC
jgi:hypothetical protein